MASHTIIALFETTPEAEQAATALRQNQALAATNVRILPDGDAGDDKRFLASLSNLSLPEEDRDGYAEAMRRGASMLAADTDDTHARQLIETLEASGAVDLDEQKAKWREETASDRQPKPIPVSKPRHTPTEEHVPLAEETLRVGKRQVNQGRVRIRSYVVETPVVETVRLRDEYVEVERRTVDRPVTPGDDAFKERVFEVTETREEPVVSKEVRVREELVIRRSVEEREETVSDTVRRTEVQEDRTDENAETR